MLYHRDVYLPASLVNLLPKGLLNVYTTQHARERARQLGLGYCPSCLDCRDIDTEVIEVDTDDNGQVKIVYRVPYSTKSDLCLAVLFCDEGAESFFLLKSCWLNDKLDTHKTLDTTRYAAKPREDTTMANKVDATITFAVYHGESKTKSDPVTHKPRPVTEIVVLMGGRTIARKVAGGRYTTEQAATEFRRNNKSFSRFPVYAEAALMNLVPA